ncbi:MAG: hypothetical protein HQM10_16190 [Candidatus Riflebacteria bacterium]|nr:hypothetical protein [Candidatus Riflebacteria bacterium]
MNRNSSYIFSVVLCCMIIGSATLSYGKNRPDNEIAEIREEISLLNLLRGLYLSADQINQLSVLAGKAQEIRDSEQDEVQKNRELIISALSDLRNTLYLAPGSEEAAQKKAGKLEKVVKDIKGENMDSLAALEDQAAAILSDAQLSIVEDFKPCLIPPKDLKNPVRVGQAGNDGILIKTAELIFLTPENLWKTRGDKFLSKILQKIEEEAGEMTASGKEDLKTRLKKISEQIRSLNKVDFELQKSSLAKELLIINPKKAMKHGHRKTGKILQFLLSDTACSVLSKWKECADKIPQFSHSESEECPSYEEAASLVESANKKDDFQNMGENLIKQLTRLHKKRSGNSSLPQINEFLAPVQKHLQQSDRAALITTVLDRLKLLASVKCDPDLQKVCVNVLRRMAQATKFPLLNPVQDPFGLNEELSALKDDPSPDTACSGLLQMAESISGFLNTKN